MSTKTPAEASVATDLASAIASDAASDVTLDTVQTLLQHYTPTAGLASTIAAAPAGASIGERLSKNPFVLAPMAGVSNAAYRLMARAGGAAWATTEMVSVAGLHFESKKTWELVLPDAAEPDVVVQLFGSKPSQFAEAAEAISQRLGSRLLALDINMACPVPKVMRKGEGSALLSDAPLACDIVRAVREHTSVEVTAKIRLGRTPDVFVACEFAKQLEDAGIAALGVHGRFASQLYRGQSDWQAVDKVARSVTLPVIASGDIFTANATFDMLNKTACAGCYIARGSYGNPWIFADARSLLRAQQSSSVQQDDSVAQAQQPPEHPLRSRLAAFELHIRLLQATGAPLVCARSLAAWYLRGIPQAASYRQQAVQCTTQEQYLDLLDTIRKECCDHA